MLLLFPFTTDSYTSLLVGGVLGLATTVSVETKPTENQGTEGVLDRKVHTKPPSRVGSGAYACLLY